MDRISKKILYNFIIFLIGSFGTKLLAFVMVPLYTEVLTTNEYGNIDIFNTNISLLLSVITLGITDAIFRFVMNRDSKNNEVLSIGFAVSTVMFLLVSSILLPLNLYIKWPYMNTMLIQLILSAYYSIMTNFIKAQQKSKYYIVIGIAQTFIMFTMNIFSLVILNLGINGYLWSVIISYLLPSIFVFFHQKIYKYIFCKLNIELLKRMMRYSIPLIFSTLSWWIISSCDKYMILYFKGESEVGIYSVANKIPLIMQTLLTILDTVWQISTNEIYESTPECLREIFEQFMKGFRTIGFVSGSVLLIITKPIMYFMARNDFYEGWIFAPVLIVAVIFPFTCGMASSLYKAYRNNKGLMISTILGAITNVGLNYIWIPQYGIMGAAVSTAVSRGIISLYQLKDTEKFLKFYRGYKEILLNMFFLVIQAITLIISDRYVYLIQFIFLLLICIINIKTLISLGYKIQKFFTKKDGPKD